MGKGDKGFHTTLSNALDAATGWAKAGLEPEEEMVAKLKKLSPPKTSVFF